MTRVDSFEKFFGASVEHSILVLKGETALMVSPFVLPGLALAFLVRMTMVWFMFCYVRL